MLWYFDKDSTKSVDSFRYYGHFNKINSFNKKGIFPFLCIIFNFLLQYYSFQSIYINLSPTCLNLFLGILFVDAILNGIIFYFLLLIFYYHCMVYILLKYVLSIVTLVIFFYHEWTFKFFTFFSHDHLLRESCDFHIYFFLM